MNSKIIVGLFLTIFSSAAQAQTDMKGMKMPQEKKKIESKPTQKAAPKSAQQADLTYTCPMHPEVQQRGPGKCPKCGMTLEKKTIKVRTNAAPKPKPTAPAVPKKTNSVSIENQKSEPETRVRDTMKTEHDVHKNSVIYACPMHPEVQSDKPGNCPKCGMKLEKQKMTNSHNMDDMNEHNMAMGSTSSTLENIKKAKKNLGAIKTTMAKNSPRTVRYDLYITDTMVNFAGKSKRAIAVNGQIPMPTLTFTEGDTAEIYVHNKLREETSLHWHGLFLPNKEDGVPYLTQMPIKPGTTYLYKFPIIQHGTHWYHSHTGLQEQIGMYGAFIMNKRKEWNIPTLPIVISEWVNMNPNEVDRSLHAATDWFAIKKGSTQSYTEAIWSKHFKTKVTNEWKRMTAMDVSDVYYDKFLINGQNINEQPQFKAGQKVRLRIANAGASSNFWMKYAGGKITVVASDGNDVEPVEVDRLLIAVSETYDVVVTIPDNRSYEYLITPEDRTKSTSLWLGSGEKVYAGNMPRLKYFAGMKMMNDMMDMQGNMIEMEGMKMQNQIMDMNTVMYPEITGSENPGGSMSMDSMQVNNMQREMTDIVTLNYNMLRAPQKTTLPDASFRELKFELTGNMNRYVWTLDNKTVSESDKILIKKGENLRIIMFNNSMMRHPMHLHGHDFRILNDQGEYSPMKNIIDIMPMERDTIEFAATESGDWFFHCHILYHMMSGMGRVLRYEDSPLNPEIPDPKKAQRKFFRDDRMPHLMGSVGLESTGSDGELMLANTRYRISTEWRLGIVPHHGYESETYIGRYFGRMQWLLPFIGFDYHYNRVRNAKDENLFGQVSNQTNRKAFVAGVQYILPMLFVAEGRIDSKGKARFQLMREDIPLTPRLRLSIMGNTDKEYMAGLRYIITKYFSVSSHYDSDMGLGAGLTITY